MPTDLPSTTIGLIGFIVAAAGYLIYRMSNQQTQTFMTYIEKKNGNLEKAQKLFVETLEARDIAFTSALMSQGARHKEQADDLTARIEANFANKV